MFYILHCNVSFYIKYMCLGQNTRLIGEKNLPTKITNSFKLGALRGAFRLYSLPQQVIPGN